MIVPSDQPVLITGATGLLGSSVVVAFHQAGFKIRAVARKPEKAEAWSKAHPEIPLEWIIVPEHSVPGAYDEAAAGCIGCIHLATPVHFFAKTADDIVKPAKEGTINLLNAAAKAGTVKRIVFTSSVAAFHNHNEEDGFLCPGNTYTDDTWNPATEESVLTGDKTPAYLYSASKTLAEKAAWKWMQDNKPSFDLTVLGPASQYGVPQQPYASMASLDHATRRLFHYLADGVESVPDNVYPTFTALLDTAEAHVKALLFPAAGGKRYHLVGGHYDYNMIIDIVRRKLPQYADRLPKVPENPQLPPHFATECAGAKRDLMMHFRTLEEVIVDEARFLFELEAKFAKK